MLTEYGLLGVAICEDELVSDCAGDDGGDGSSVRDG